jgi:hypothetical protein
MRAIESQADRLFEKLERTRANIRRLEKCMRSTKQFRRWKKWRGVSQQLLTRLMKVRFALETR